MPVDMWLLYSKQIKARYVRDKSFKFITDTSFPCCSFTTALNAQLNAALKGFNIAAGAGVNQAAGFFLYSSNKQRYSGVATQTVSLLKIW